jgi:RND family efflux transporter MFP subunit
MRRSVIIAVALLVLAAAGAGAWWLLAGPGGGNGVGNGGEGGGQAGGPPAGPGGRQGPLPVAVEPVAIETVPEFRQYVATVRAVEAVEVRAQVTGYLVDMPFTEGGLVERGELLFRIDPRPFQARISRLEAERDAQAASRDFAQTQLQRFLPLAEEDFATEERIDELRTEREQAAAQVNALTADLRRARLDLEYSTIASPIDGRVGFANVDVGDLVQAVGEQPLVTVVQLDPIYVTFDPTDTEFDRLIGPDGEPRPLTVEVLLPGGEQYAYDGTLAQVDNQFDPTTGTIAARALVPNPDHQLRPGQFARARLILEQRENALLVPSRALGSDQGRRFVYVFADGTAERRFVETGGVYGERTLILDGLEPSDRVIVDNLQRVQDGTAVEIRGQAQAREQAGGSG